MAIGKDNDMWNTRRYMDYYLYPFYSVSLTASIWSMVSEKVVTDIIHVIYLTLVQ